MKHLSVIAVLLLSIVISPALDAQSDKVSFLVYGNMTVPTGAFGKKIGTGAEITRRFGLNIGDDVGLANWGLGIGVEMSNTVFDTDASWVLSARYLLNSTEDSEITSFFRNELDDSVSIAFENGSWANIPIFTGMKYSFDVYGIAQAGINITRQAPRKAIIAGIVVEETTFKFRADFGFEVGVGVQYMERYNIGVRYLNLGTPRYEGIRKMNESFFTTIPRREMTIDGDARSISMVLIVIGVVL
jgi:hypothetical protein